MSLKITIYVGFLLRVSENEASCQLFPMDAGLSGYCGGLRRHTTLRVFPAFTRFETWIYVSPRLSSWGTLAPNRYPRNLSMDLANETNPCILFRTTFLQDGNTHRLHCSCSSSDGLLDTHPLSGLS